MDYHQLLSFTHQWIMNNLPPLPLVKQNTPIFDPYEIDPTHYTNTNSFYDISNSSYTYNNYHMFNSQNYQENLNDIDTNQYDSDYDYDYDYANDSMTESESEYEEYT